MGLEEDKVVPAHLTFVFGTKPLSRALIAHRMLHVLNQRGTQMLSDG
jgi:argininosuccinate synthase